MTWHVVSVDIRMYGLVDQCTRITVNYETITVRDY